MPLVSCAIHVNMVFPDVATFDFGNKIAGASGGVLSESTS